VALELQRIRSLLDGRPSPGQHRLGYVGAGRDEQAEKDEHLQHEAPHFEEPSAQADAALPTTWVKNSLRGS